MRKRKKVSLTLAPETAEYIDRLVDKENGRNKGIVVDLLVDVLRGNFIDQMIIDHYHNVFKKYDGRTTR
jgi:methyl coenzyme M reductase subunit C